MTKVAMILGSETDLKITGKGVDFLREQEIPFELRIGSAHRTPDHVHQMVKSYEQQGVACFICVAGMSAHLAGVVASLTLKPVLAVPVVSEGAGGLDALLSMVNMPPGVPVGTFGFGSSGFLNACIFASQVLGTQDPQQTERLVAHRSAMAEKVVASDGANKQQL